jgi:hypothetical protein
MYFCEECKTWIQTESPDEEPYQVKGKDACKKCWVKAIGDELEKHPIVSTKFLRNKNE